MFKSRIFKNSTAAVISKLSGTCFRVLSVPLLIASMGLEQYGGWLVISSVPTWLALINIGVGTSGANGMAMAGAKNDVTKVSAIYTNTVAAILLLFLVGTAGIAGAVYFIPFSDLLGLKGHSNAEIATAILLLGASTLASLLKDIFGGCYLYARRAPLLYVINSAQPWLQLLAIAILSTMTVTYAGLGAAVAVATLLFLAISWGVTAKIAPKVRFRTSLLSFAEIKAHASKGVAFQAFPLGNALMFQGSLLAVNSILGASAVAIFSTSRTLTRSVNQLLEVINQTIWPELSHKIGHEDWQGAQRIHRRAVVGSFLAGMTGMVVLFFAGPWIYGVWTKGHINISPSLLAFFLFSVPGAAMWSTSAVVQLSCNQHENLAKRYIIGSVASLACCWWATGRFGLEGAAMATTCLDLVLIPFVINRSLAILHDTWGGFAGGIWNDFLALPKVLRRTA